MSNVGLSIYERLQKVRKEIKDLKLVKSGKNKDKGFEYYELADFLSQATELFEKHGLCPVNYIQKETIGNGMDYDIVEYGILDIFAPDGSKITFRVPTAENTIYKSVYEGNKKIGNEIVPQNDIQNLGAKKTYIKRYLYMDALDLSEPDSVDPNSGINDDEPKKSTITKPTAPASKPVTSKPTSKPVETPIAETVSDEKICQASKDDITALLTSKGLEIIPTMTKIAKDLGYATPALFKESDKSKIIELIEKEGK